MRVALWRRRWRPLSRLQTALMIVFLDDRFLKATLGAADFRWVAMSWAKRPSPSEAMGEVYVGVPKGLGELPEKPLAIQASCCPQPRGRTPKRRRPIFLNEARPSASRPFSSTRTVRAESRRFGPEEGATLLSSPWRLVRASSPLGCFWETPPRPEPSSGEHLPAPDVVVYRAWPARRACTHAPRKARQQGKAMQVGLRAPRRSLRTTAGVGVTRRVSSPTSRAIAAPHETRHGNKTRTAP